jgi:hypothetical protein
LRNFVIFIVTAGGESMVLAMKDGKKAVVAHSPTAPRGPRGGTVTILVQCVGSKYVFSLNGDVVAVRDIPGPAEGAVGVIAGKTAGAPQGPSQVLFDNLKVWQRQ